VLMNKIKDSESTINSNYACVHNALF